MAAEFAFPMNLPLPYTPNIGWTVEDYKEILNKNHDSLISSDAIDNIRNIEYYYNNGKMSQLERDSAISIISNNLSETGQRILIDDTAILLLALQKGIGLYQTFTGANIRNSSLLINPPEADMSSDTKYQRMIQENADGTLSDSGMTLTSIKLSNMLSGYLASIGIQSKSGSMDEITQKFVNDNKGDTKFENWLAVSGTSPYAFNLLKADANDPDAVMFYAPNYFVDKFGEWILNNQELFEGARGKVNPVLNVTYDKDNRLPISALTAEDFIANIPPSDSTMRDVYDAFVAQYGSFGAAVNELYQHTYSYLKSVYDANATLVARFGEMNQTDFLMEFKIYNLSLYNSTTPQMVCQLAVVPYLKNNSGNDNGIYFQNYDSTRVNTGLWLNQNTVAFSGRTSNGNTTIITARSVMDVDGNFDYITNWPYYGTSNLSVWGLGADSGQVAVCYSNNVIGEGNANFNKDSTATPYDENSGTLSSFINGLTGLTNFLNKTGVIDDDNKLWSYYIPNILNIDNKTTTNTQAQQIATKVKYKDIADDDEKNKDTGMVLNPTGTAEKTKINAKEATETIATEKDETLDISLTETQTQDISNNPDLTLPIVPDVTLPTVNANSFITAYKVSDSNLNAVGAKLWSADWLSILQNLGAGDAISDAIISLNTIFSPIAPSDTSQPLKIAGIQIGTETAGKISARYSTVTLGYIKFKSFFNNYKDYQCTFELYLPGIGYVTIDNSLILNNMSSGGRTIRVDFTIDWYTGEGVYVVYTTRKENGSYMKTGIIGCYSANCGSSIPVTNRSFNQLIGNLSKAASDMWAAPATGGLSMLGAAAGVFAGGGMVGNISTKGSYTANALAAGPKSIFVRRTKPSSVFNQDIKTLKNLPDYRAAYLANLKGSGLTQIDSSSLKGAFTCTSSELDEIKSLLESGVIL